MVQEGQVNIHNGETVMGLVGRARAGMIIAGGSGWRKTKGGIVKGGKGGKSQLAKWKRQLGLKGQIKREAYRTA